MAVKRRKFTPEEKRAILENIQAQIKAGHSIKEACETAGIHKNIFYLWRSRQKNESGQAKRVYTKRKPELIEMPIVDSNLMILWGKPADVNAALERIARIQTHQAYGYR